MKLFACFNVNPKFKIQIVTDTESFRLSKLIWTSGGKLYELDSLNCVYKGYCQSSLFNLNTTPTARTEWLVTVTVG